LILGELIVRNKGADVLGLSPALAETLTLMAAYGRPMLARELRSAHSHSPAMDAFNQYISRLKNRFDIPIVSEGPRGRTRYQLDPGKCRVDAMAFGHGVEAGNDVDDLLRLWRGTPPEGVLNAPAVKEALDRLIKRIGDLADVDQAALAELPRFAALFPDDRALDQFRRSGPHSKPRLLIVEDNAEMMEEIRGRLETAYRLKCLASIEDWRKFRGDRAALGLIQGALIDLSLTPDGDDRRGLEIVRYLQDNTEIPAALVTANRMESSEFRQAERMEEFRLVDIVSKQSANWYDALEATADLLVGRGVGERQRRMETWLNAAHRKVRRETHDAAPGSVAAGRRQRCDAEYVTVLGYVRIGDVDAAQKAVDRFCLTWRTSD
jgi:CheY-like chemotaxis protein